MFTRPPKWTNALLTCLSRAIQVLHPASVVLLDLSFVLSEHADLLASVLLDRGFATTTRIQRFVAETDLPKKTILAEKIAVGSKKMAFLLDTADAFPFSVGYGHYLGLLAFRKLFWKAIKDRIERENSRCSPDTEWPVVVEHYAGIRGRRLAEEGWNRQNDPSLFFGEELLVQGMLASVLKGADVVFITCDPLLVDQFFKLGRFLVDHYLAAEFGRKYAARPGDFPTSSPTKVPDMMRSFAISCDQDGRSRFCRASRTS